MAYFIARSPANKLIAVRDDQETGEASTEMLRLIDRGFTLYRVSNGGDGTFVLTPQRVVANSEVTESRLIGADLEDETP